MMRRYVLALLSLCGFLYCAEAVAAEQCPNSPNSLIPSCFQPLVNAAKDISTVWSGVTDAIKVLQLLGVIQGDISNRDLADKLDKLDKELLELVGILYEEAVLIDRDDAISLATTASKLVDEALSNNTPLNDNAIANAYSLLAVETFLNSSTQFTRLYNDSATNGGTGWKDIIPDRADIMLSSLPPEHKRITYDWRVSLAHYLTAIALRLKVISAVHPAWRVDGHYDSIELKPIAEDLLSHLQKMLDGVRCDSHVFAKNAQYDEDGNFAFYVVSTGIACADIYTGISSVQILPQLVDFKTRTFAEPHLNPFIFGFSPDQEAGHVSLREDDFAFYFDRVIPIMESLYRRVLLQLPIYELRSMIDTLHLYLSHAPDLTATLQRIPVERPPANSGSPVLPPSGLCLAWQEPLVGPINISAVVLLPCTGEDRQRWVYTRAAQPDNPDPQTITTLIPGGEIRNPLTDKCLDVAGASPMAHTQLQIFDCNGTDAQKWTYDPMTRVLQSAVSTVLDTPGSDVFHVFCLPFVLPLLCLPDQPLFFPQNVGLRTWWRTEDTSQQWHADLPGDPNADGKVDCSDLAIVRGSFGKRTGQAGFDFRADVNSDGVVDVRDLAFVARKLPVGMPCP
jgi:Ricin-type beta-trefoil lectin domain/Dockerin type I domain